MVPLADAASVAQDTEPGRAAETMGEVASTGRQALTDMRRMLGLLRDEGGGHGSLRPHAAAVRAPQPGIDELEGLVERVRATGLPVVLGWQGVPFELSEAAELTTYRIVQEALTNALRHAVSPGEVRVTLVFGDPNLSVQVTDNGSGVAVGAARSPNFTSGGHGVTNMTERAAAFDGSLTAGPLVGGGWRVETTLYGCRAPVRL
jgi:signal transduction histidine kinase